jgi:hypothetical protein
MTFKIMTLRITFKKCVTSIMTFSITALKIMTISMTFKACDTQHNDIQCEDTQHNDTLHNNKNGIPSKMALTIIASSVRPSVVQAECTVFIQI